MERLRGLSRSQLGLTADINDSLPITVVEADMNNFIDKFLLDQSTAFGHITPGTFKTRDI